MSFGSSFVQTLTPTLREVLGQAIQTREAKKRYEEYFRQQGELTAQQQANALAQIAERERVAQDKFTRESDAKKMERYQTPAVGYMYRGKFFPDLSKGAPVGAQTIYGYDVGQGGVAKFIEEALNPNAPRIPITVGGQEVPATVSEVLQSERNKETARNNRDKSARAAAKDEAPKAPKPPSASEELNRRKLFPALLQELNIPTKITVPGVKGAVDVTYPDAFARYLAATDSLPPKSAFLAVMEDGLGKPAISSAIPAEGIFGEVKASDGGLVINKWGPLKDSSVTPQEAIEYLVSKGADRLAAEKRVADLIGSPTTAADDELGY